MVVAHAVGVPTKRADDGTLAYRALRDRMIKRMATVAPSEDGERDVFFNPCHSSEERRWVVEHLGQVGTVKVNKCQGDRGVTFLKGNIP
jgi:hypothetical protein